MLSNGTLTCTYDSANRLTSAGGHTYTYNAEDVRIRNLCEDEDTTYTYNTNAKLSMLLMKTTNGVVTKYVYGKGLIGEESNNTFKTYHFDFRGSTIAITDACGNITDTFAYDTYGKLTSRTGTTPVIFGYNGRDGVVTDDNGLIYMRARYYSPEMKRFVNADIVAGQISNAITLNRFAYANGNPVSFVDPFGLSAERAGITKQEFEYFLNIYNELLVFSKKQKKAIFEVKMGSTKYYQNVETTLGQGIDIDKILEGQLEISKSINFADGIFEKNYDTEGNVGIKYSLNADEYNNISISSTFNLIKQTYNLEHQITTQVEKNLSVSTTVGIEKTTQMNKIPPVHDTVAEEQKESSFGHNLLQFGETFADSAITIGEEIVDGFEAFGKVVQKTCEQIPVIGILLIGLLVLVPVP